MADSWKKVELGESWNYKEEKPGAEFEGRLLKVEEGVGENNSKLYTFKTPKGDIINVWGCNVLDVRLQHVEAGEDVRLVYLGQAASEKRKGKFYHNFDVYHRALPMEKVEDSVDIEDVSI